MLFELNKKYKFKDTKGFVDGISTDMNRKLVSVLKDREFIVKEIVDSTVEKIQFVGGTESYTCFELCGNTVSMGAGIFYTHEAKFFELIEPKVVVAWRDVTISDKWNITDPVSSEAADELARYHMDNGASEAFVMTRNLEFKAVPTVEIISNKVED